MSETIFNFETEETVADYIARCGTDTCAFCRKAVPKAWGIRYLNGKFECIRCEEAREDARRDQYE